MLVTHVVVGMFAAGTMVLGASRAAAQDYPNKPIRLVASEPGGGSDFASRLIAQGISGGMGQVIVDNRGGGVIPAEFVSRAPPDGYTLLLQSSTLWVGPLLQNTPYDPIRDFSPITLVQTSPMILVVNSSLPVTSVEKLIYLAKSRPGDLNYGSTGSGSTTHLAAELFKAMAGVNIVRIPYKGSGPALNNLVAGEVQVMFPPGASAIPHVKSGRLRALAITSAQPSTLFPGMPTVAASGLRGYESAVTTAVFAPAKTPETIINRLHQEIVRFLNTADAKERFRSGGSETVGSSPEQLSLTMKSEMIRMGKVIKDAGIRAE